MDNNLVSGDIIRDSPEAVCLLTASDSSRDYEIEIGVVAGIRQSMCGLPWTDYKVNWIHSVPWRTIVDMSRSSLSVYCPKDEIFSEDEDEEEDE